MKIVSYLLHDSAEECWVWRRALKVLCQPNVKALNNLVWGTFLERLGDRYLILCYLQNQF